MAESGEWIVVETEYPTECGCYRGRRWTRLDLIQRSDVKTHGPYFTRAEAIDGARELASREYHFEGEDFDDLDDPPWDSANLENYDNDEEVRFEVMTRMEHDASVADDRSYVALEFGKLRYDAKLREKVLVAQVRSAGRVYYGFNGEMDIAAELEVVEKRRDCGVGSCVVLKGGPTEAAIPTVAADNTAPASPAAADTFAPGSYVVVRGLQNATQYNGRVGYVHSDLSSKGRHAVALLPMRDAKAAGIETRPSNLVHATVPVAPPPAAMTAKTLRFDANDEELRCAPTETGTAPPPPPEDALAALCRQMPALTEIHYFGTRFLTEARVLAVLGAAPHLAHTLTHFRCARLDMTPKAVAAMAGFRALERLDMTNCIVCGLPCDNDNGSDSDDPYEEKLAYEEPLAAVLRAMPRLVQLDLGYGDDSLITDFWRWCVSKSFMQRLKSKYRRCTITLSDMRDPLAFPFAGGQVEQEAAIADAILELTKDSDEGVRANAIAALAGSKGAKIQGTPTAQASQGGR